MEAVRVGPAVSGAVNDGPGCPVPVGAAEVLFMARAITHPDTLDESFR